MKDKSLIRLYSEPKELSATDKAKYIVEKQSEISEYLNKYDWYLFDETPVDLKKKENIEQLVNRPTIDGFYASKKNNDYASFKYNLNATDKNNNASSLITINFDSVKGLSEFKEFKQLLSALIQIFQPYSIEVSRFGA
jgi:hypothetical protein